MSYQLRLRFREIAVRLQVLNFANSDYTTKTLFNLAAQYREPSLNHAQQKGYDLEDPDTLWEILGIDAVISLENIEGKLVRVGVSLVEDERTKLNLIYEAKRKISQKLHQALNFDQYWIIKVKSNHFPPPLGWVDVLYGEVDQPVGKFNYKLVTI